MVMVGLQAWPAEASDRGQEVMAILKSMHTHTVQIVIYRRTQTLNTR
jgi:hypothetical protein